MHRLFLILVISLLFLGCSEYRNKVTQEDLDLCAEKMKVCFPKSTHAIGIWKEYGMDDSIALKIEIEEVDLNEFIKNSPFSNTELKGDRNFYLGPDKGWWDPQKHKNLKAAQEGLPNGEALNIGVLESSKNKIIIYLFWYQT